VIYCIGSVCSIGSAATDPEVDFSRDVLPVIADNCLKCHGPDQKTRQADMRLDRGELGESRFERVDELLERVSSNDPEIRMPPPSSGQRLRDTEIAVLRKWVAQGAQWSTHWSLTPIARPALPKPVLPKPVLPKPVLPKPSERSTSLELNPIDRFVTASRRQRKIAGSRAASRNDLIRRVSFSLTGLPPTIDEVKLFLADRRPGAYERMVDRYLASPRYGEHMAAFWLDLARYADTNGYHADNHREMWRWRDWVIEAWNQNLPFDEFTIHQLAGDLIEDASHTTRLATGFHRNTMVMFENGALPEEFLPKYVSDRVATTATVWLGQTFECARCHDHKYEPITQRDYYRLFAYFNNIDELGLGGQDAPARPFLHFPTRIQHQDLDENDRLVVSQAEQQAERRAFAGKTIASWEPILASSAAPIPAKDTAIYLSFDEQSGDALLDGDKQIGRVIGSLVRLPNSQSKGGLLLTDKTRIELRKTQQPAPNQSWTLTTWLYCTTSGSMLLYRHKDTSWIAENGQGVQIRIVDNRAQVEFTGDLSAKWTAKGKTLIPKNSWHHVAFRYEVQTGRISIRMDREWMEVEQPEERPPTYRPVSAPALISDSKEPLRGMLDEFRLFHRHLDETELDLLMGADPMAEILAIDTEKRSAKQRDALVEYYLERLDQPFQAATQEIARLKLVRADIERQIPTSLVMQERVERRPTHILNRGDYLQPGKQEVFPGIPTFLSKSESNDDNKSSTVDDRLGLAKWIVSKENPLTARVFVNHVWRLHFGRGIVETPGDFGIRGIPPTHPELLDWLAAEFVDSGWDVKRLHRLMVTSATFRQTSRVTGTQFASDPENRWYSRGPRFRLTAESIRDTALQTAGLLDSRLNGPSVSPYQPAGLWKEVSYNPTDYSAQVFRQSHGADLYRRGMYTFWKRSAPPPNMVAFGAPTREICVVQRSRSETATQVLVLMNDPTFVEAARVLGTNLLTHPGEDAARIRRLWMATMSRLPTAAEEHATLRALDKLRETFANDETAANDLLKVGEYPLRSTTSIMAPARTELAAWTCLCSVILQQDEVLSQH
jgi:hypothetical protein